jgi:hypothetical protein
VSLSGLSRPPAWIGVTQPLEPSRSFHWPYWLLRPVRRAVACWRGTVAITLAGIIGMRPPRYVDEERVVIDLVARLRREKFTA